MPLRSRFFAAVAALLLIGAAAWWAWPRGPLLPHGELRVAIDPSLPPFAFATDAGFAGLEIDLAQALAARLGVPLRFVPMGFDGVYDSLRSDRADIAIAALVVNPAQTRDVRYSPPYFDAGLVLVNTQNMTNTADLPTRRIAFEYGAQAETMLRQWARTLDPFTMQAYELPSYALDAARFGVADAALVDHASARLYLRGYPAWQPALAPLTTLPYAIASRADNPALADALARTLQAMRDDGALAALLAKWL
jgi:polar amino acid transport system substrate-binding protein